MYLVCAGLGDHVDQTARSAPELGGEAVRNNLEFLHGVERDSKILRLERTEKFGIEIIGAVDTINHQTAVVALLAAQADAPAQTRNNLRRGTQLREVAVVAAGKRQ